MTDDRILLGHGSGGRLSHRLIEEFFLPPYKRMFARWKAAGVRHIVAHHDVMAATCYPILDMFVEAGLTGVQGVYPTAGLTLPAFKNRYGKKLSVIGGILGIVVGLGLGLAGSYALHITFTPDMRVVVASFIFSAFVGVVFGYFPARRAARLDPIEALRYQ